MDLHRIPLSGNPSAFGPFFFVQYCIHMSLLGNRPLLGDSTFGGYNTNTILLVVVVAVVVYLIMSRRPGRPAVAPFVGLAAAEEGTPYNRWGYAYRY